LVAPLKLDSSYLGDAGMACSFASLLQGYNKMAQVISRHFSYILDATHEIGKQPHREFNMVDCLRA